MLNFKLPFGNKAETIIGKVKEKFNNIKTDINNGNIDIKKSIKTVGIPVLCTSLIIGLGINTFSPKSFSFESTGVTYMEQPVTRAATAVRAGGELVNAYGLYINNEFVGALDSEENLDKCLTDILNVASSKFKNATAEFNSSVKTEAGLFGKDQVITPDMLKATISSSFKDYISVKETVTEVVSIPYSVTTTHDATKDKEYRFTKQEGKDGSKKVTSEITYINGVKKSVNVLDTVIIKEAVDKVMVTGEQIHDGFATGDFIWPCPYTKTIFSGFGYREDGYHRGVDINDNGINGTDILASDGGVVTVSQYDNYGYGYHIEIDHGNGYVTRYAHCGDLLVNAGDRVSRGTVIAKVGNTGYSEAPHLHFEILFNGNCVDPELYV